MSERRRAHFIEQLKELHEDAHRDCPAVAALAAGITTALYGRREDALAYHQAAFSIHLQV